MTPSRVHPGDPAVSEELARSHGLTNDEYDLICGILSREPTYTELGIFSALWSEHCAYKHSRKVLETLPTKGDRVVQGPGENAGVLRLGDGWAVAFKIESHNHPSAVEPYQGAATGVGGILRDVFTMGARPVALLNSLRFGDLSSARNRYLLAGVTRGIGDYGNCVGVPTIGGEVDFAPGYDGNPLINAMCVGILREDQVTRAVASGEGNVLIIVGSRTGRDGIHGASFASEELSAKSDERRPQVQVGDPFTEKLLIEASLELITSGCVVAVQDMGAAGLASSSAEMAARGGVGVEIDICKVPTREPDMSPYEILLSESQERMLVIAQPDRVDEIMSITDKWELEAAVIGEITSDGFYRITAGSTTVAEIPSGPLIENCPAYTPQALEDPKTREMRAVCPSQGEIDLSASLIQLLRTPGIASNRWVFEQYDSTVRAHTVIKPGGDGGVIRIPDTSMGIALSTDCNWRYMSLDPYEGAKSAVAEAARNVACTGARPIGITNCLNFGNPEKSTVYFQFVEACRGIAEACTALDTPVTGGNVSFYNESPTGAIPPTPVIGMVGLLTDVGNALTPYFIQPGDRIMILGRTAGHLGGSALWKYVLKTLGGSPPPVDLDQERKLIQVLVRVAEAGLVSSAHDVGDGGLAVCLAEACIGRSYGNELFGATVDLSGMQDGLDPAALLFGEDQGRALVGLPESNVDAVLHIASENGVPAIIAGTVGNLGDPLILKFGGTSLTFELEELRQAYFDAIPQFMKQTAVQLNTEQTQ